MGVFRARPWPLPAGVAARKDEAEPCQQKSGSDTFLRHWRAAIKRAPRLAAVKRQKAAALVRIPLDEETDGLKKVLRLADKPFARRSRVFQESHDFASHLAKDEVASS
jgi:hypothetical protein